MTQREYRAGDLVQCAGGAWTIVGALANEAGYLYVNNVELCGPADSFKLLCPAADSLDACWAAIVASGLFSPLGDRADSSMWDMPIPSTMDDTTDEEDQDNCGFLCLWHRPEEPHYPISVSVECNTHDPEVLRKAHNYMAALLEYIKRCGAKEQV
jgi:hypothetical protein